MTLPSMTSMNQRSSLYWVLSASSPSEMPKSNGVRWCSALTVWMAASRTWGPDTITGEYAEPSLVGAPTGADQPK